jgi:hypothetical protein
LQQLYQQTRAYMQLRLWHLGHIERNAIGQRKRDRMEKEKEQDW